MPGERSESRAQRCVKPLVAVCEESAAEEMRVGGFVDFHGLAEGEAEERRNGLRMLSCRTGRGLEGERDGYILLRKHAAEDTDEEGSLLGETFLVEEAENCICKSWKVALRK